MKPRMGQLENYAAHALLIFFALTALLPLSLVLVNSLKPHAEVVRNPVALSQLIALNNFVEAWE